MSVIIAGIHTGIGKTICSAVLCQALGYDYWKPVQAGELNNSDSLFIKKNITNKSVTIHPEIFQLQTSASPHYAASVDGITISKEQIILPNTNKNIVVETAGGIMSPLATNFLNIDLIEWLQLPVVLVSNNYLGSINHTLLSVAVLQQRNILIKGIVFSGQNIASTQSFILQHTQLPLLFSIPYFNKIDAAEINKFCTNTIIKI